MVRFMVMMWSAMTVNLAVQDDSSRSIDLIVTMQSLSNSVLMYRSKTDAAFVMFIIKN